MTKVIGDTDVRALLKAHGFTPVDVAVSSDRPDRPRPASILVWFRTEDEANRFHGLVERMIPKASCSPTVEGTWVVSLSV